MRFQINRLGSRPGEFHPVKSAPLFLLKELAQPYIDRLESKSAKRSKYGPSQYVALPVPGPGQSKESFDREFFQMVELHRQRLEIDPTYAENRRYRVWFKDYTPPADQREYVALPGEFPTQDAAGKAQISAVRTGQYPTGMWAIIPIQARPENPGLWGGCYSFE